MAELPANCQTQLGLFFSFTASCCAMSSCQKTPSAEHKTNISATHPNNSDNLLSIPCPHHLPGKVRWARPSCRQAALLPTLPVISPGSFACLLRAVKRLFISWQFINMYWAWRMRVKQLLFLFLKKIKHDKLSYSCKPSACYLWLCRIQMVKLSEWVHSSKKTVRGRNTGFNLPLPIRFCTYVSSSSTGSAVAWYQEHLFHYYLPILRGLICLQRTEKKLHM